MCCIYKLQPETYQWLLQKDSTKTLNGKLVGNNQFHPSKTGCLEPQAGKGSVAEESMFEEIEL